MTRTFRACDGRKVRVNVSAAEITARIRFAAGILTAEAAGFLILCRCAGLI